MTTGHRDHGSRRYVPSMSKTPEPTPPIRGRSIEKRELQAVIRRAAELSFSESEGDERLSEDELVRIAAELGLAPHLARQALYELPELESEPSMFEGPFGAAVITGSRLIPGDAERALARLEDYLTTREYLQITRRGGSRTLFTPADDTISYLARGLLRPRHRFQLARARRVAVTSRHVDAGTTHVQIATDMADQRRGSIRGSIAAGTIVGLGVGGLGSLVVAGVGLPETATVAALILALGSGIAGSVAAAVKLGGARFRTRMAAAKLELDGLLDRAERGERLDPPPAPWRRRLQLSMLGGRDRG